MGAGMYAWTRKLGAGAALLVACLGAPGCASEIEVDDDSSADALRAPEPGIDIDVLLAENIPVSKRPPAALAHVASWSIRHVELRDPKNPSNPDPEDPFNGFFLIAKDAAGKDLFFDAMALTDSGVAHLYFSVSTDEEGNFLELPLIAPTDDPKGKARVDELNAWLQGERTHLAEHLSKMFDEKATSSTQSLSPLFWGDWGWGESLTALKCAADLAVLGLLISNPIAYFVVQAGVDGTFALLDAAVDGGQAVDHATSAAVNGTLGAVAGGAGRAVKRAVDRGTIRKATVDTAKKGGLVVAGVALVGVVGYQAYEDGAAGALSAAIDLVIPESCKQTYKHLTEVPQNDVTPE